MAKLEELKKAIETLEGKDLEAIKSALALVGESPGAMPATGGTYTGGSEVKIAVLQRGWVMVGRFTQEGSRCVLEDASVVERWGTTKGLGELAQGGPLTNTRLRAVPRVAFHELTAVQVIDCEDKAWLAKLR